MSRIELKKGESILEMYPHEMRVIKQLISAPHDLLNSIYLRLLSNLAEYLQNQTVSFTDKTPLIKRQLDYTIMMLKIKQGLLLPKYANIETIAAQEAVWSYALFTLAIFKNLDSVLSDRSGSIYLPSDEKLGDWHPLSGFFYEPKTSYEMRYSSDIKNDMTISKREWAYFLVAKFISPVAIQWLAQYETLFKAWKKTMFHLEDKENILDNLLRSLDAISSVKTDEQEKPKIDEENHSKTMVLESQVEDSQITNSISNGLDLFFEKLGAQLNHPEIFLSLSGLFISESALDEIAQNDQSLKAEWLSDLNQTSSIVQSNNSDGHCVLSSKNISRKVVMKGWMLKVSALPEGIQKQLKTMGKNTEFFENLSL